MDDWNVVATVRSDGFNRALRFLRQFGAVNRTGLYNVLVLKTADIRTFLDRLRDRWTDDPDVAASIGRVIPVTQTFDFQSSEEFEAQAREAALSLVPELAGKTFHVRFHRRGFKGQLSSADEERFLDETLLGALESAGRPGHIRFEDPDAVLVVETVGNRGGLSLWSREDLQRYPFLRPD